MSIEGCGAVRFWGFSQARSLLPELDAAAKQATDANAAAAAAGGKALLVCPGDVRHMLETLKCIAQRNSESKGEEPAPTVEFAVYEREPEVLARHMLLLSIALDFELPRRERAEVLLEVWANTQIREKTAAYVAARAVVLSRVLAHDEGPLAPFFDTSALKARARHPAHPERWFTLQLPQGQVEVLELHPPA